jgi:hypothetical protein
MTGIEAVLLDATASPVALMPAVLVIEPLTPGATETVIEKRKTAPAGSIGTAREEAVEGHAAPALAVQVTDPRVRPLPSCSVPTTSAALSVDTLVNVSSSWNAPVAGTAPAGPEAVIATRSPGVG